MSTSRLVPCEAWVMSLLERRNLGQRVVLVVGLGFCLERVGEYVTGLGGFTGWTGYAPLTNPGPELSGGLHPWVRLVIWLVLAAVWVVASLAVLRARSTPTEPEG